MPRPGTWTVLLIPERRAVYFGASTNARSGRWASAKFISSATRPTSTKSICWTISQDEKTSVIAMYLEDVTNGRQVHRDGPRHLLGNAQAHVVSEVGPFAAEGAKAVTSHTGSLAGSDSVYDALLIQSGVQRVDTIAELVRLTPLLYTTQPLPRGGRAWPSSQCRRAGHHGHRRGPCVTV